MMKRLFDFVVSLVLFPFVLLISLPLMCAIMIENFGWPLFVQKRIGLKGKVFHLVKFRSMVVNAEKTGGYQTLDNDPRITKVGAFLRKTSLDELPQLWNVLKGDMSLVGPRPDTPMQESNYAPEDWQLRHSVRPGITGLSQVKGRSDISAESRLDYDLQYARDHNFWLDLRIMFMTVGVILKMSASN